jgi:hypothetical protein
LAWPSFLLVHAPLLRYQRHGSTVAPLDRVTDKIRNDLRMTTAGTCESQMHLRRPFRAALFNIEHPRALLARSMDAGDSS